MKFNSVKEYFYKLNNTGYQLMMVPLILFTGYYSQSYFFDTKLKIELPSVSAYLPFAFLGIAVIVLTTVQLVFRSNVRKVASKIGLGIKLEKLGTQLKSRMIWQALIALIMPLGLVLTDDPLFIIFFVLALTWYFIHWPSPTLVSRLLRLRGDEKEMVLSRGEAFK
ncbi:MAG: hypothetical protein JNM78_02465 [Cyclobacteriaceae bacterium]|nr:hypothetical protein [Cyclobacteriaceae bacterium]